MTRAAFTLAGLMLVLSLSTFAQSSGSSRSAPLARRSFAVTKMVVGKVAEINAAQLVLENDFGAQKALKLDGKTKFRLLARKSVKRSAIPTGLLVKVTFREADLTATLVQETVRKFQD
jgi:hypothetical protein